MKCARDGLHFLTQKTTKEVMKKLPKEDLAVSREQSALLKPALKRAHTARHSPRVSEHIKDLITQPDKGEASRNMVSAPEGALGLHRVWLNSKAPPLHREDVRAIRTTLIPKS